jgi:hypothetical protein
MGCCNAAKDINECNTIEDLIGFCKALKERADTEQTEINNYLNDKSKIPKTVNINEHNDDTLAQRSNFLNEYKEALDTGINTLSQNKLIDFKQAKTQVETFSQAYLLQEDTNKVLDQINNNLTTLLEYANNGYVNQS